MVPLPRARARPLLALPLAPGPARLTIAGGAEGGLGARMCGAAMAEAAGGRAAKPLLLLVLALVGVIMFLVPPPPRALSSPWAM